MKTTLWIALATVALLAVASPAAAKSGSWTAESYLKEAVSFGTITVAAGSTSILVGWEGITLGEQSSHDLRALADGALSGEKDGQVTQEEIDNIVLALRTMFENQFNGYLSQHGSAGLVVIDSSEPKSLAVTKISADGLQGPVDQKGNIVVSLALRFNFPGVDENKDLHTVKVDMSPYQISSGHEQEAGAAARDLTLTVRGQKGWSIDAGSVQPDCAAEKFKDGTIVFTGTDASCFTGHSVLLAFTISGHGSENFLPGFDATLLLGALAMGGVLVSRRRA